MAYFDWNATAPLLEEARQAWLSASESAWANPSTPYRAGVQSRLLLEESRERLSTLLGVDPRQVIFTSGATEANNGMIREAARRRQPGQKIWISAIEHPSVRATAVEFWGLADVVTIPVLPTGTVDLDWVADQLKGDRPALVGVMAVNNETGVIQPWQAILSLCRDAGVPFHCDAVQWMGKQELAGEPWASCAGLTISGHKFGAPKGIGCLVLGPEWMGLKVQSGGAQEFDSRAGTENVAGAVAMTTALQWRTEHSLPAPFRTALSRFEDKIAAVWADEVVIHGRAASRVWNTCSICLPSHRAERWIARLDKKGFQVSSGSACSTGKEGPSTVLAAMGVDQEAARRTIRISSGWETVPADWENLFEALIQARAELDEPEGSRGPGSVIEL